MLSLIWTLSILNISNEVIYSKEEVSFITKFEISIFFKFLKFKFVKDKEGIYSELKGFESISSPCKRKSKF